MKLYPAIDLVAGQAVRLAQGRFEDMTVYDHSPLDLARRYAAAGHLHIVDLDGAKQGSPAHTELITRLVTELVAATELKIQIGGGIRSQDDVQRLLDAGADRVVIGSLAVKDPEATEVIFGAVGPERVTLAVDVRRDERGVPWVATHGWQKSESLTPYQLIEQYLAQGLQCVLCTDISRDGEMRGPNVELYRDLAGRYGEVAILASGGVSSLDDLRALKDTGAAGAVVGKALLEGVFTIEEAVEALAC